VKAPLRETGSFFREYMPPMSRKLFYTLTVAFVVSVLLMSVGGQVGATVLGYFILTPAGAFFQYQIWQLLTFAFVQLSLLAFLLQMLGLFFLGRIIEEQLGGRRFLAFVILSALGVGLLHAVFFAIGAQVRNPALGSIPLLGFSGPLYAMLIAIIVMNPSVRFHMIFFEIPARVLGVIVGFIILIEIAVNPSYFAHGIGGVGMGWLLIKVPGILDFFEDFRPPGRKRRRRTARVIGMGHPGRHSDVDDLYNDPHWKLDQ